MDAHHKLKKALEDIAVPQMETRLSAPDGIDKVLGEFIELAKNYSNNVNEENLLELLLLTSTVAATTRDLDQFMAGVLAFLRELHSHFQDCTEYDSESIQALDGKVLALLLAKNQA